MRVTDHVQREIPPEVLFRLRQRRPGALRDLALLTRRADWKARALAASALGLIAREDPLGRLTKPICRLLRPFPRLRMLIPATGYCGRFSRRPVADRLEDASWFVRTGTVLALGEILDPHTEQALRAALQDPMRPVRIAAAASLVAMGIELDQTAPEILDGAEPAPVRLDGFAATADWLEYLIRPHLGVLAGWVRLGIQLMDPHRRLLSRDYSRGDLPVDVEPGASVDVPVDISLPHEKTPYVLKLDLVDELVCWFEERGSRAVYIAF